MPLPTLLAIIVLPSAWLLERLDHLPSSLKRVAPRILIQFCYPCLILASLPTGILGDELLQLWPLPIATALLLLLGRQVGRILLPFAALAEEGQRRSFIFAAILPNYSYVPLLLAQVFWGERGLAFVMLSSIGADLVLWTLALAELKGTRTWSWRGLCNPPLVSLLASLLLLAPFGAPLQVFLAPLFPLLKLIGSTTIPLSMLVLGAQLARKMPSRDDARAQSLLLSWRLALAPALMFVCLRFFVPPLPAPAGPILLLVASMPGAIVSVVLAELYAASPDLAARHVLWGHLAWLGTGSFWLWMGRSFF